MDLDKNLIHKSQSTLSIRFFALEVYICFWNLYLFIEFYTEDDKKKKEFSCLKKKNAKYIFVNFLSMNGFK